MEKTLKVLAILTSSAVVALVVAYFPASLKVGGVCRIKGDHVEYNVVIDGRGLRSANNTRIAFDFWDSAHGKLDRLLQFDPSTDHTLIEGQSNDRFIIRLKDPVTFSQHLTVHVADVSYVDGKVPVHPKVVVSADHTRDKSVDWKCEE